MGGAGGGSPGPEGRLRHDCMYWPEPAFGVIVSAMGVTGLVRGTFSVCVCRGGRLTRDYGRLSGSDREAMGRASGS